ncbi:UBX domain-containing protein 7 [Wickerhamomyces ciferrii]|uniref:UBX domain-containing protein 7 n=1 Tax=Wickerhamomyces ciferrii (strain ATCC 14091 / BCRC 22168 / CBS 111 / JCM 3599 / NBRC 0793 / NRRL Y-1031 F-60-10) TaxID=1206466 RepID=K0KRV7_WICCF|nr:UBX domain-containing protein 7 [Wickerhamomyces ciferrii]CCH44064.1 UBX domain-containing protein 7 [Wickerhamomyces ciferrii]
MSEQVDTFLAITGSSDAQAAETFLEMGGGDLEAAIALFFEHGPSIAQQSGGGVASSSSNNFNSANDEDDAALAERLQNEAYQNQQQNEPRAPDAAVHERLVGGDDQFGVFPGTFGGIGGSFNGLLNQQRSSTPNNFFGGGRPGIFNQRDDLDSDEDDRVVEVDSDGEEISTGLNETQRRLARIFRPPFDLIEKIDLNMAKQKGRAEKRWLMVNIQNNGEFQCQVLNRDFWSTTSIKNIVKENFIFLQYQHDSSSGQDYSNFYHFQDYPHIAILDPLTGERLKMWSEVPSVNSWIQEVKEFLDQFSLDPGHINPTVEHKKKVDPSTLTEEQQMELAIQQSLGSKNPDDKDDVKILNSGDQSDPIELDDDEEDEQKPKELSDEDKFKQIEAIDHPEPENNPTTTTRVQIRLGDGSRRVRRFNTDDKVKVIYEVLKATVDQVKEGQLFTLTSQRENLFNKLDETINDAGLKNASILLELVDDQAE